MGFILIYTRRADPIQVNDHMNAHAHDRRGLSDIIAALEGAAGKKGAKETTVTACAAQKTVTVTEQAAAAAGGSG